MIIRQHWVLFIPQLKTYWAVDVLIFAIKLLLIVSPCWLKGFREAVTPLCNTCCILTINTVLTHEGPVNKQLLQFLSGNFILLHPPGCPDGQTCFSGMQGELPNHCTFKGHIRVQIKQKSRCHGAIDDKKKWPNMNVTSSLPQWISWRKRFIINPSVLCQSIGQLQWSL